MINRQLLGLAALVVFLMPLELYAPEVPAVSAGDRCGRFELSIVETKLHGQELCPLFGWLGFVPVGLIYHQARGTLEWRGFSPRFDAVPADNLWPLYRLVVDNSRRKPRYSVERLE